MTLSVESAMSNDHFFGHRQLKVYVKISKIKKPSKNSFFILFHSRPITYFDMFYQQTIINKIKNSTLKTLNIHSFLKIALDRRNDKRNNYVHINYFCKWFL